MQLARPMWRSRYHSGRGFLQISPVRVPGCWSRTVLITRQPSPRQDDYRLDRKWREIMTGQACRVSALGAHSYPHHARLASTLIELAKKKGGEKPIGFCCHSFTFADDDTPGIRLYFPCNSGNDGSWSDWQPTCFSLMEYARSWWLHRGRRWWKSKIKYA